MVKLRVMMLGMLLTLLVAPVQAASQEPVGRVANSPNAIVFVENVGQFPPEVRFYALGAGLWIGDDGVWRQEAGGRRQDAGCKRQEAGCRG